ncbi:MAG: alkaline phosphatase [Verrucomicrobia bacterium]|nr:alkaline phosphatase [Verrucomicrobiota bacterium]
MKRLYPKLKSLPILILTAFSTLGFTTTAHGEVAGVQHVVIIGCDGMSPNGVLKAKTPVMRQLMKEGAYTLHARGVMPTSSSPNWASMIMGAGPEQHGVTSNDWETNKFDITPIAVGSGGIFPTIFGLLRDQRPKSVIACFHDWDGFGRLFERKAADMIEDSDGPTNAVEHAVAYIRQKKPTFTFIHLDHVDHVGHQIGHGTPEYFASVEVADKLIGEVIQGLKDANIWKQTILLITADHGGVGKGHGGATMAEIEIPWIIVGPGVAVGREIKRPVNTYDTAVTVAYIFGLRPPECWIGKPVMDAFKVSR